jgi:ribonuclease-3
MSAAAKDAKTALQEWLQGRKMALPAYEVMRVLGAAHRQTFEVRCRVAEKGLEALGQGASRRAAEQAAATAMLQLLQRTGT